jgi:protein CWC15
VNVWQDTLIQKRRQPGQTSTSEVAKRDLRAELLAAEQEARDRKRKAEGLPSASVELIENGVSGDEDKNKRRKLIQEAMDLDKDDDDDDESNGGDGKGKEDKDDADER